MTRTFDAPASLVWEVWTKPEHVRYWWRSLNPRGPRESEMLVCEIDLRVGGRWRYVARESNGFEVAFNGEFLEIEAPHRLVNTEVFEMYPDNPGTITNVFEEHDGKTTLTSTAVYESKEVRDMVVESGMEDGADISMDRIEELLESLQQQ